MCNVVQLGMLQTCLLLPELRMLLVLLRWLESVRVLLRRLEPVRMLGILVINPETGEYLWAALPPYIY